MPPVNARTPAKGAGKGLNRKSIGGLPLWAVVIGGALTVVIAYRLYQAHKTGATSGSTSAAPLADTGASTGGAGTSGGDPNAGLTQDLTPYTDLATALNGLSSQLAYGSGNFGSSTQQPTYIVLPNTATSTPLVTTPAPQSSATTSPYLNSFNPGSIYADPATGAPVALQSSGALAPAYIGPSGDWVSPLTYRGAGVDPQPISGAQAPPVVIPPQQIPAPVLRDTIIPAPAAKTSAPAPAKKSTPVISGYSQKSKANLH